MKRYKCNVCNHIYDPSEGDVLTEVEAGTPFEELPEGWKCPICGVGTDLFTEINEM